MSVARHPNWGPKGRVRVTPKCGGVGPLHTSNLGPFKIVFPILEAVAFVQGSI